MAIKTVKKISTKKSKKTIAKGPKKTGRNAASSKKGPSKKTSASKGPLRTKKTLTEKEKAIKEANAIANSEKKKKPLGKRPKKTSTPEQVSGLLDAVVEGMKERKGKNIMVLNLQNIENRVTDFFVICDADSKTHVNSIAESVEEIVEKLAKEKAYHSEGNQNGEWILIDYINVVAHIFLRETREHYNIEGLWGDAEISLIND
jgi:ribosome-associated protein